MLISSGIRHQVSGLCPRTPEATRHRAERLGEGLGHRGGVERRARGWSSDPMIEADVRARGCCRYRSAWCARPTGDRYVRTTDAPAQRREGAKLRAAPDRSEGTARGIIEAGARKAPTLE